MNVRPFTGFYVLLFTMVTLQCLQAAENPKTIAPLVDHHQHLLSSAGADIVTVSLPPIELPSDLALLLKKRVERWNDKEALSELYLEDSVALLGEAGGWVRGRKDVVEFLSGLFSRPFQLTPIAFRIQNESGHVAGYLTRENKHLAYFYFGLQKDSRHGWRIASEIDTVIRAEKPVSSEDLLAMLDDAGIERAVILSDAYYFDGMDNKSDADPYPKVKAENDWTAEQTGKYPDRLIAFCSFNPLKPYAIKELERCSKNPVFRGMKLHFNNSQIDLNNPEHVHKVREVFAAANKINFAIIVHLRADGTYGSAHAKIFLNQIVAVAPDVPVQIAHFWGGGGFSDEALAVFSDAVSAGDPNTKNLYFDVAQLALVARGSSEILQTSVRRMRQIGLKRILYASDGPQFGGVPPGEAWRAFRKDVPLTEEEFRMIANNVAPYFARD